MKLVKKIWKTKWLFSSYFLVILNLKNLVFTWLQLTVENGGVEAGQVRYRTCYTWEKRMSDSSHSLRIFTRLHKKCDKGLERRCAVQVRMVFFLLGPFKFVIKSFKHIKMS